jgi:hypothetical protein
MSFRYGYIQRAGFELSYIVQCDCNFFSDDGFKGLCSWLFFKKIGLSLLETQTWALCTLMPIVLGDLQAIWFEAEYQWLLQLNWMRWHSIRFQLTQIYPHPWASHRKQAWMNFHHQRIAFLKDQINQQKLVGCNSSTIIVFAISCFCKSIESCSNLPHLNRCWNYRFGEIFEPLLYSSCLEIKVAGQNPLTKSIQWALLMALCIGSCSLSNKTKWVTFYFSILICCNFP